MMHTRPGIGEVSREIAETVGKIDKERRKRTAPRMVTTEGVLVSLGDVDEMKNRARRAQLSDSNALPPFVIVQGLSYDVMAHSDAIIVCSGTATVEAAILRAPMVIIYRGSRFMEFEYKVRRIKVDHIGLPNIIANERIVPEYIQHDATPEALAESTLRYLRDPEHRAQTRKRLESVKDALGSPGASARTADLVLETAGLT
jgi:lipid-A-disaccharide synthase